MDLFPFGLLHCLLVLWDGNCEDTCQEESRDHREISVGEVSRNLPSEYVRLLSTRRNKKPEANWLEQYETSLFHNIPHPE